MGVSVQLNVRSAMVVAPDVDVSVRRLMLRMGDAMRVLYNCWQRSCPWGALLRAPVVPVVGCFDGGNFGLAVSIAVAVALSAEDQEV